MNTTILKYQNNEISFKQSDGSVMINATEMARPFSKRSTIWLDNQTTIDFLQEISKVRNLTLADLVTVRKGGNASGTWMHEDVALEFSRWLSPAFAIWCNDRIKELLKFGATAVNPDDLLNPDFIIRLATELKNEREAKSLLEAEKEHLKLIGVLQADRIRIMKPKELFADSVVTSKSSCMVSELAKILKHLDQIGNPAFIQGLFKFFQEKFSSTCLTRLPSK